MSNDNLSEHESNSGEKIFSGPFKAKTNSNPVTHWSLSTMLIWMVGPLACVVMANFWEGGFRQSPLPVSTVIGNGLFKTAVLYCLMFLPLLWLFAKNGTRFVFRIPVCIVVSFFFVVLITPRLIFCVWVCAISIGAICQFERTRKLLTKRQIGAALASATILMSVGVYSVSMELWPTYELRRLMELRAEYPIIDLTSRKARLKGLSESPVNLGKEGHEMQSRLQVVYGNGSAPSMMHSLKRVHDTQFERFVRSPGFGHVRLNPRLIPYWVKPTFEMASNTKTDRVSGYDYDYSTTFRPLAAEPTEAREKLSPTDVHLWTYFDFLHPTTFGEALDQGTYVANRPHGVSYPSSLLLNSERFSLEKLELMGLLLHESPVVYETDGMPDMESIAKGEIATRALNSFEADSLGKLRNGESLVIENGGEKLLMVGAVRAIDQCSECHQSNPGDLLGAFSYEFRLDIKTP